MSPKINNPDGKKGSPEHKSKVNEIIELVKAKDLNDFVEYPVPTPKGKKKVRYVDVAGLDKDTNFPVEFHQVGVLEKDGKPVKREQEAIDDIENNAVFKIKVNFHPYKSK